MPRIHRLLTLEQEHQKVFFKVPINDILARAKLLRVKKHEGL